MWTRKRRRLNIRLDEGAQLPRRGRDLDAGYDLVATHALDLPVHASGVVDTGVSLDLPRGTAGFVVPRSGLAARHGISIVNAPGLIDPGYTGNIKVVLCNLGTEDFAVTPGMRIAQLVFVDVHTPRLRVTTRLRTSQRGDAGFGSSGV